MFILQQNNKCLYTKREEVTKQGFCRNTLKKTPSSGKSLITELFNFNFNVIVTQVGGVWVDAYFDWEGEGVGVGA